jgi:hypothetical protein
MVPASSLGPVQRDRHQGRGGRFFASFVVEAESEPQPAVLDGAGQPVEVGIELGLSTYAVLSNGR